MKKALGGLSVAILIFAGCSNGEETEETVESNTYDSNEESDVDEDDTFHDDEIEEEPDLTEEENEDETADEEEASEELETTHYLAGDHTVQPLDENLEEKVVLLTIDDAPDRHGVDMAEALVELDAGAIFFVNGHFLQSDEGKEELKEIYDLGFEIGNHTMNHPNMSDLTEDEQYKEIMDLNDLIEEVTGERPRFYRAPFGVNTEYTKQLIEEEGMQWMNWTYGYDYNADYMEAKALAEIMVETEFLRNGANLLMHDRSFTYEALEDMVNGLREKGYEPLNPKHIE
ncbi:polysaccharide deacetylase family protein [Alteribacter aurantiacus]|uniref:polysaccharide deacetylase family protein n=1 Tax=Alteribacter aurantiacus TaxID=254410 RepID=UPI00040777DB|nr:polysaccharide deacetylase family protein [Alteribacter aurantiacus]